MLLQLHVKNLALIKEAELDFGDGFHVLTGETGAGKSLLLGSVNLALGGKASADLIRKDADFALAELIFSVDCEEVRNALAELEIPLEDDTIILQRRLQGSRSTCRINGETVPASKLREIAELMIDIHGQHEHQSLLKKANHRRVLDQFAGDGMKALLAKLSEAYSEYMSALKALESEDTDVRSREREISLIKYEINEIESAALVPGEDEVLETECRRMANSQQIMEALGAAAQLLGACGISDGDGARDRVGRALKEINSVAHFDEGTADIASMLADIESMLSDADHALAGVMDSMTFDREEFYNAQKRLDLINTLKSKYGRTIEDILAYMEEQTIKLEKYEDYDAYLDKLKSALDESEKLVKMLCKEVSALRHSAAEAFSKKMQEALVGLNFERVGFEARVSDSGRISREGTDDVEFLISMNPGEPLKSLSEIASGGELSRIMLAIRTVGAADTIGTLIFDEIDAGISGRTATQVAKKLSLLSESRQVICITHLPQIAAFADHHYRIEKSFTEDSTTTTIEKLIDEQSVEELTRLLGDTVSAADNARELKSAAMEYKSSLI